MAGIVASPAFRPQGTAFSGKWRHSSPSAYCRLTGAAQVPEGGSAPQGWNDRNGFLWVV